MERGAIEGGRRRAGDPVQWSRPERSISVITVTRNAVGVLARCLDSVQAQSHPEVEHLIVDAASTDGTVDVLRGHGDRIAWWRSEEDGGIYDAMNKGIAAARGSWICFLGADDALAGPDVLAQVASRLDPGLSLAYGDVRYPAGRRVRSRLGPRILLRNTVHHQGAFYAARTFRDFRYDASLRLIADYELNLRLYVARAPCRRLPVLVAECADAGASRVRLREAFRETNAVRRKVLGPVTGTALGMAYALEFGAFLLAGRTARGREARGE